MILCLTQSERNVLKKIKNVLALENQKMDIKYPGMQSETAKWIKSIHFF
jgi:hypothetical protein